MVLIWESLTADRKNYMKISFKGGWFMKSRRDFFGRAIEELRIEFLLIYPERKQFQLWIQAFSSLSPYLSANNAEYIL